MLATNGPRWLHHQRPQHTWPSIVVSVGITAALFVSAFLAMQTVGRWHGQRSETVEPPVMVRFTPPPPPIERPRPTPARVTPSQPTVVDPSQPIVSPPIVPTAVAPSTQVPVAPAVRDTSSGASRPSSNIPLGPLPVTGAASNTASGSNGSGANAQSGVTIGSRTPNTPAYRDSVLRSKLQDAAWLSATRAPTGENLAALRNSQRNALGVYRRNTTSGSAEVHVPQGEGMNGEGAVGGGSGVKGNRTTLGSGFALPLLSKGPSAAQRKRNEALEADYRERLHRLDERILLKRDSIRLDSLRRDSLAKRRP